MNKILFKSIIENYINIIKSFWNLIVPSRFIIPRSIKHHLELTSEINNILNSKKYVVGFLFNQPKDMVVLIRKKRPEWQNGKLNGVGGKMEYGESALEAMAREFKEETGLEIKDWREFAVMNHSGNTIHFFTAWNLYMPVQQMTDEEVGWYNISDIKNENIIQNLKWLIPAALDKDGIFARIEDPSHRNMVKK